MKPYILLLLLLATLPAAAQKIQKVCGEYTYYVPENVSRSAAMRTALERAKIQALADKFGTIVLASLNENMRIRSISRFPIVVVEMSLLATSSPYLMAVTDNSPSVTTESAAQSSGSGSGSAFGKAACGAIAIAAAHIAVANTIFMPQNYHQKTVQAITIFSEKMPRRGENRLALRIFVKRCS